MISTLIKFLKRAKNTIHKQAEEIPTLCEKFSGPSQDAVIEKLQEQLKSIQGFAEDTTTELEKAMKEVARLEGQLEELALCSRLRIIIRKAVLEKEYSRHHGIKEDLKCVKRGNGARHGGAAYISLTYIWGLVDICLPNVP